jgi:hypothetical protein
MKEGRRKKGKKKRRGRRSGFEGEGRQEVDAERESAY